MAILRSPETEKALDPTAMRSRTEKNIFDTEYITIPVYEYRDLVRSSVIADKVIEVLTSKLNQYEKVDAVRVIVGLDPREEEA